MSQAIPDNPSNTHLLITLTRVETRLEDYLRRIDSVEQRVTKLEAHRWPLPALGAISGVLGAVGAVFAVFH